jgi:hypothetical protein
MNALQRDSERKRLWQISNKDLLNYRRRISRAKNRIEERRKANERNARNRIRVRELHRKWILLHPGKEKKYSYDYYRRNPYSRLKEARTNKYFAWLLRSRLSAALKGKAKAKPTLELLGCDIGLLKLHLQNQFRDGMAWNNHGSHWHIDHIKPCASFDLSNPKEQSKCFHYSNLQPLLVSENLRKSSKMI